LISIADDPFLSPMHVALRLEGARLLVEDQGSRNGTFLRIRGQADIKQGSEFIVGRQRLVLIGLGGPTTDVRTPVSADTKPYGGPLPRQLFVALRQLHAAADGHGRAAAVVLRTGPVVTIGQRGCDLSFPQDTLLATRHVELHVRATGVQLLDVSASSGAFVRLKAPAPLQNGDELMVGEEIFRVEMG
jgi:hypothetical protein